MIRVSGLGCELDGQRVLHDVSFEVGAGDLLLVVGSSGAGKTTLLQHLNGVLPPQEGRIKVDELDLSRRGDRRKAPRLVGLALQSPEHQVYRDRVWDDVAIGPLAKNMEDVDEVVRWALERLDAAHLASKNTWGLSSGERRRVALAGILAMQPPYLALDEPTAGLDAPGRRHLKTVIEEVRRDGVGVVVATHDPDEFITVATRVLVLEKGHVVALGAPEDVYPYTGTEFAQLGQTLIKRGLLDRPPLSPDELLGVLE